MMHGQNHIKSVWSVNSNGVV